MTTWFTPDPDAFYVAAVDEPECFVGEWDDGRRAHVITIRFTGGPNTHLKPDVESTTLTIVLSEGHALALARYIAEHALHGWDIEGHHRQG